MASKPIGQMTAAEMRERLLELKLAEEQCWQQVAAYRMEAAEIELALYRASASGTKK